MKKLWINRRTIDMKRICYFSLLFFIVVIVSTECAFSQKGNPKEPIYFTDKLNLTFVSKLPPQIQAVSGIAISKQGNIWVHNDEGLPVLYCLDSLANLKRTLYLNHQNKAWKNLSNAYDGRFYLGAFSKKNQKTIQSKIYSLENPDLINNEIYTGKITNIKFENKNTQQANVEGIEIFAFIKIDSSFILFAKEPTKADTDLISIYTIPNHAGSYNPLLIDSLNLVGRKSPLKNLGGASLSPDKKLIALISNDCIWFITGFHEKSFNRAKVYKFDLNKTSNFGGIAFYSNTILFLVEKGVKDINNSSLYRLDIGSIKSKIK